MFITSQLQDKIALNPTQLQEEHIIEAINIKYANKNMGKLGIGIMARSITKIHYFKALENCVVCSVDFDILVFRFVENELIYGKIVDQNENGICVEIGFYGRINLDRINFMDDFEVVTCPNTKKGLYWLWNYKGHKLYFKNGSILRFKVHWRGSELGGRINETGLGPVDWWE